MAGFVDTNLRNWLDQLLSPRNEICNSTTGPIKTGELTLTPPAIVRAETNFLRFPFFALSTKNIHKIDSLEVTGTRTIKTEKGESKVDFKYRVSRNTDHVFPGQLSRKIHFALLSIIAKQGPSPLNPIRFTWRQLAREMGISYGGGKMIREMKQAIRSTHGTIIRTDQALIDGTLEDRSTLKRERGMHLYEDYCFQDEKLSDGSATDRNEVFLSNWYFNNLKARYIQPLNFDLWLQLNQKTPVASRLYEYLVFVFGRNSFRKIRYQKLAASIPLTVVTGPARMRRQLDPALTVLRKAKLLKRANWSKGKYGDVILELQKGEAMKPVRSAFANVQQDEEQVHMETKESHHELCPTDRFIVDYYRMRFGYDHQVTTSERKFASGFIERHGYAALSRQLPKLVRQMECHYPDGRNIVATAQMLGQLMRAQPTAKTTIDAESEKERNEQLSSQRNERKQTLEEQWTTLTDLQKSQVEQIAIQRLGRKSKSPGFRLMLLHEANRLFFES